MSHIENSFDDMRVVGYKATKRANTMALIQLTLTFVLLGVLGFGVSTLIGEDDWAIWFAYFGFAIIFLLLIGYMYSAITTLAMPKKLVTIRNNHVVLRRRLKKNIEIDFDEIVDITIRTESSWSWLDGVIGEGVVLALLLDLFSWLTLDRFIFKKNRKYRILFRVRKKGGSENDDREIAQKYVANTQEVVDLLKAEIFTPERMSRIDLPKPPSLKRYDIVKLVTDKYLYTGLKHGDLGVVIAKLSDDEFLIDFTEIQDFATQKYDEQISIRFSLADIKLELAD